MSHIVLLGDSIFDNAVYVNGGPDVIAHLRKILPSGWEATLLAVDGSVTEDVAGQVKKIPPTATHLIVSAGGNDALGDIDILHRPAESVGAALSALGKLRARFREDYRRMIATLQSSGKPLAVCTIYDANFEDPTMREVVTTALTVYNDVIIREAVGFGLPILDLRSICAGPDDYANEIEPGIQGGRKIAAGILELVRKHDFTTATASIYK